MQSFQKHVLTLRHPIVYLYYNVNVLLWRVWSRCLHEAWTDWPWLLSIGWDLHCSWRGYLLPLQLKGWEPWVPFVFLWLCTNWGGGGCVDDPCTVSLATLAACYVSMVIVIASMKSNSSSATLNGAFKTASFSIEQMNRVRSLGILHGSKFRSGSILSSSSG